MVTVQLDKKRSPLNVQDNRGIGKHIGSPDAVAG